jgi:hypothetical protein
VPHWRTPWRTRNVLEILLLAMGAVGLCGFVAWFVQNWALFCRNWLKLPHPQRAQRTAAARGLVDFAGRSQRSQAVTIRPVHWRRGRDVRSSRHARLRGA